MSDHRYGKTARRLGTHWDGRRLSPPCATCGKRKRGAIVTKRGVTCRRCMMREMREQGIRCPGKHEWRWLLSKSGAHMVTSWL